MVDHWWLDLPQNRCGTDLKLKLYLLGRFEKFYQDREVQMIEGEERYHIKLLGLLRIT